MTKKIIACVVMLVCGALIFSASYINNTYQKLADQYSRQAEKAFDAGEYDKAIEYARLAEENAALSRAYIDKMARRQNAEQAMGLARARIEWARSINAERDFPIAFSAAVTAYDNAKAAFDIEDYETAVRYAQEAVASLEGVRELTPLPEYYVVRPWVDTSDCYWNISGRSYIYNNPLLWENLYQVEENQKNMPQPNNPDLIWPGMKMRIPSLTGEYRAGEYNPSKTYDPYSAER